MGKSCPNLETPHQPLEQEAGGAALVPEAAAAVHKTSAAVEG
jgi:hypothetical protein